MHHAWYWKCLTFRHRIGALVTGTAIILQLTFSSGIHQLILILSGHMQAVTDHLPPAPHIHMVVKVGGNVGLYMFYSELGT